MSTGSSREALSLLREQVVETGRYLRKAAGETRRPLVRAELQQYALQLDDFALALDRAITRATGEASPILRALPWDPSEPRSCGEGDLACIQYAIAGERRLVGAYRAAISEPTLSKWFLLIRGQQSAIERVLERLSQLRTQLAADQVESDANRV